MTAGVGVPRPGSHASIRLGRQARECVGLLGDAIRDAPEQQAWWRPWSAGGSVPLAALDEHLGRAGVEVLVAAGLATVVDGGVSSAITIVEVAGSLAVIPKQAWGDEIVYLGPDSAHLAEAVLRLAPTGDRAAELGTGTGLLAALVARRFRTVVATDLAPSVAVAAGITLALNRYPPGHRATAVATDVAAGLRPGAFDLVAANPPWVPLADGRDGSRALFSHGGDVGVELPARFVREGADLLRPGGLAITLALDVTLADGARPLEPLRAELVDAGFAVATVATPFNRERPNLLDLVRSRQARIDAATHVAVVVARPRHPGDARGSLLVAVEALRRRWATRPVTEEAVAAAAGPGRP